MKDSLMNEFDYITMPSSLFQHEEHRRYWQLVLVGAGIGLSAYSALEEGKAAAEEGKAIQAGKYAEAKEEEKAGEYEAREKRKEKARTIASIIADISARGGTISGTNLTSIASTASEYEADAWMLWRNRKVQASQLRYEGDIARYQGRMARRTSRIRAVAGLGAGVGKMYMAGMFKGIWPSKTSTSTLPRVGTVTSQAGAMYARY